MEKAAAEAELQEEGRINKRKFFTSGESESSTSSVIFKTTPENSASSMSSENSTTCESVSSASCCCRLSAQGSESADLDEQHNEVAVEFFATSAGNSADFTYGRDKRPSIEVEAEMEPETIPRGSNSHRCSAEEKMPSEAELEEFFAAAEKNLQQQFMDKYNYDIVNDEPVEGRYEWVQIQHRKPCPMTKLKKKAFSI